MAIDITFDGKIVENSAVGYKISCCLTPQVGFQEEFFVYVELERAAHEEGDFFTMREGSEPHNGTLAFLGQNSDNGPKHEFENIDLQASHLRYRQNRKNRVLEFMYRDEHMQGHDSSPVSLENTWENTLKDNRLGDECVVTLNGRTDGLLGMSLRQTYSASHLLRLSWYSNNENSFLNEIIERTNTWSPLSFNVGSHEFEIPHEDLRCVYVDHSFGSFLASPLPTALQIFDKHANTNQRSLAQYDIQDDTGSELLGSEAGDQNSRSARPNRVVETVTFLLDSPKYAQLEIV